VFLNCTKIDFFRSDKKRIQHLEDKSLIENRVLTEEERSEHVELLKAITAWEHSKKN